ncbi:MAG: glycosyltransferase family 4 protein [Nitriliruptoraceae bacterium]|jgi:UDP-GlcNAc:undecaprenyl-phosphate GlcNAc-1-phosphate transferase
MSPTARSVLDAVLAFGAAALVSLVLTPVAIAAAVRLGVLDRPGAHKSHRTPTPYLGGVAIVLAVALTIGAAALLRPDPRALTTLAGLLGVGVGMAVVGLLDDLRGLPVAIRFGAQLAAALGLWGLGIRADVPGSTAVDLAVTVVWVVGITNALNLLDNMDALSGSTATIAAAWFAVLALIEGQVLVGALAAALAGGAAGFLRDNRPPARIYMGDAGSLFLGVMLAALGLLIEFDSLLAGAAVPILVLTVPVLDTTLVVAARIRHGISPFQGGRDHTSHRLVRLGLPVPVAVGLIAAAGFAHGWVALIVTRVDTTSAWLLIGLAAAFDLVLLGLLAKVPVYDNSRGRDLVITERVPAT